MIIAFREEPWEDYLYWQRADAKILKRINALIRDMGRDPYVGVGTPEPLRHEWSGWWSRRIDHEHRLVYRVDESSILIAQCRYHY